MCNNNNHKRHYQFYQMGNLWGVGGWREESNAILWISGIYMLSRAWECWRMWKWLCSSHIAHYLSTVLPSVWLPHFTVINNPLSPIRSTFHRCMGNHGFNCFFPRKETESNWYSHEGNLISRAAQIYIDFLFLHALAS